MAARIHIDLDAIAAFCERWHIVDFALFGSVLRDDFRPESDVDVLVVYAPGTQWYLQQMQQMQDDLKALFGRPVDLVEGRLVEESKNYIRRKHILRSAKTIYTTSPDPVPRPDL